MFTVTRRKLFQENPGGRYIFPRYIPRVGMFHAYNFGVPLEFRAALRFLRIRKREKKRMIPSQT